MSAVTRGGILCLGIALLSFSVSAQTPLGELRKPTPDSQAQPYRERLQAIIRERYPELLKGRTSGIPVVTIVLNFDGTVFGTRLDMLDKQSRLLTASEAQFADFGLAAGELQYIGVGRVSLPGETALVVFGARDSRELDRALVERFFPDSLTQRSIDRLWVLFDHEGRVLRTGREHIEPTNLRNILEERYPGIHIADATVTPLIRRDGRPLERADRTRLQLNCLWLAADSSLPEP